MYVAIIWHVAVTERFQLMFSLRESIVHPCLMTTDRDCLTHSCLLPPMRVHTKISWNCRKNSGTNVLRCSVYCNVYIICYLTNTYGLLTNKHSYVSDFILWCYCSYAIVLNNKCSNKCNKYISYMSIVWFQHSFSWKYLVGIARKIHV